MRHITVYFSDGDTISTQINGTDDEIIQHYLGRSFEAGSDTQHHVGILVHFHDTDKKYGLPKANEKAWLIIPVTDITSEIALIEGKMGDNFSDPEIYGKLKVQRDLLASLVKFYKPK
jgi:hypothetical protein